MLNQAMLKLGPLPQRLARLPVSPDGFFVPWFVAWINEVPDFRCIGPGKIRDAIKRKLCWICGEPLGRTFAFVLGPMCAINRTVSEPPSHLTCAMVAVRACPFLTKPSMRRNEKDLPEERRDASGIHLDRNPGAVCIWVTREYSLMRVENGNGILFTVGEPVQALWFAQGRTATRAEVMASIDSGLPTLRAYAAKEGPESVRDLEKLIERAQPLLPTTKENADADASVNV